MLMKTSAVNKMQWKQQYATMCAKNFEAKLIDAP